MSRRHNKTHHQTETIASTMPPELQPVGPVHNLGKRSRSTDNDQETADMAADFLDQTFKDAGQWIPKL